MYCVRNVPRSAKSLALGEDNRLTSTVNLPLPLSCVANGIILSRCLTDDPTCPIFHLIAETELFRFCDIIA